MEPYEAHWSQGLVQDSLPEFHINYCVLIYNYRGCFWIYKVQDGLDSDLTIFGSYCTINI